MSITFLKILAGAHRVAEALVATTGMCTLPTAPALTVEKGLRGQISHQCSMSVRYSTQSGTINRMAPRNVLSPVAELKTSTLSSQFEIHFIFSQAHVPGQGRLWSDCLRVPAAKIRLDPAKQGETVHIPRLSYWS